jgi:hypothetical protein
VEIGAEPRDSILVVEAEVVTPAAALPPPGFTRALQVDRYRVLRVISGEYDHEELFAARDAGEAFIVGDRLRLTLSPQLPEGGTPMIEDPVAVNRLGLYFVAMFERLPWSVGDDLPHVNTKGRLPAD